MAAALEIRGLSKHFGAVVASDAVSLSLAPGELLAVIGPNGAGKTSLIAQIAGALRPDSGEVLLQGRAVTRLGVAARARLGLGRSFQITSLFPKETLSYNFQLALNATSAAALSPWRAFAGSAEERFHALLGRLGLSDLAEQRVAALSHGDRRLVEVGMALAAEPKVLLLDEPMAGLGAEESRRMIALLKAIKGASQGAAPAILLVEHDMDAVFSLADRIVVLVNGRVIAEGSAAEIAANPEVRSAYLGDEA